MNCSCQISHDTVRTPKRPARPQAAGATQRGPWGRWTGQPRRSLAWGVLLRHQVPEDAGCKARRAHETRPTAGGARGPAVTQRARARARPFPGGGGRGWRGSAGRGPARRAPAVRLSGCRWGCAAALPPGSLTGLRRLPGCSVNRPGADGGGASADGAARAGQRGARAADGDGGPGGRAAPAERPEPACVGPRGGGDFLRAGPDSAGPWPRRPRLR